jgi:hypothetical protein
MGNQTLQNFVSGKSELKENLDFLSRCGFPNAPELFHELLFYWRKTEMKTLADNNRFFESFNTLSHTRDNQELKEKIDLAHATENILSPNLSPDLVAGLVDPHAMNGTQIYFTPDEVRRFTELQKAKIFFAHMLLQAHQGVLADPKVIHLAICRK